MYASNIFTMLTVRVERRNGGRLQLHFFTHCGELCHFVLYSFFLYSSSCPRFTLRLFPCIPLYTPALRSVASPYRDATSRAYRFRWFSRPNCRRPYRLHRYSTAVPGLDSQQHNRHSFLSPRCPGELRDHETSYAINP